MERRTDPNIVQDTLARKKVRGLAWKQVDLRTAVTWLRTVTGVAFVISPKVMEEKHEDIVIDLQLDEVSVKQVVDLITEPYGLRWEVRKDVVWILTTEETDGSLRLRKPELPAAMKKRFDETTVSLSVTDQTLGDVIKVLQIQTGFNLMIDSRSESDIKNNPISGLNLEDISLTTVLAMLASAAGDQFVWIGQGNVAVLTHREHAR